MAPREAEKIPSPIGKHYHPRKHSSVNRWLQGNAVEEEDRDENDEYRESHHQVPPPGAQVFGKKLKASFVHGFTPPCTPWISS